MKPGIYNLPNIRRGDTYKSIVIVNGLRYSDGTPIPCTSAKLQIKNIFGDTVFTYPNISITGANSNVITLPAINATSTSNFSAGACTYDLEVLTTLGETWTLLEGTVQIDSDISI